MWWLDGGELCGSSLYMILACVGDFFVGGGGGDCACESMAGGDDDSGEACVDSWVFHYVG